MKKLLSVLLMCSMLLLLSSCGLSDAVKGVLGENSESERPTLNIDIPTGKPEKPDKPDASSQGSEKSAEVSDPQDTDNATTEEAPAVSQEPVYAELPLGTPVSVANYADLTLQRVITTDRVIATMGGSNGRAYFLTDDSGRILVDMLFTWLNTQADSQSSWYLMNATATGSDGTVYTEFKVSTEETGSDGVACRDISSGSIEPGDTAKVHVSIPIPADEESLTIRLEMQNTVLTYEYLVGQVETALPEMHIGDTLEASCGTLTFHMVNYASEYQPETVPSWGITVMGQNPEDNTFLTPIISLTSKASDMQYPDYFVYITALYEGDTHLYFDSLYPDVAYYETLGTETEMAGYNSEISPGGTYTMLYLITVPVTNTNQPVTLFFSFGGQDYVCHIG